MALPAHGWDPGGVNFPHDSVWVALEAERAFDRAVRARRRGSLTRRMLRRCTECAQLAVYEARRRGSARSRRATELPLDAITGSLEPHRAGDFDGEFRPSPRMRSRWQRIWMAEAAGATLPPIVVAAVDDGYAVVDGHHRVSVARARGAVTIPAIVR
jgi:ParB-like nuclease domain